jgi:hypothetical protein
MQRLTPQVLAMSEWVSSRTNRQAWMLVAADICIPISQWAGFSCRVANSPGSRHVFPKTSAENETDVAVAWFVSNAFEAAGGRKTMRNQE